MVKSNLTLRYQHKESKMNNNPIKLLFELTGTAVDVFNEYKKKGEILADDKKSNLRMELCGKCKSFDKEAGRCTLCGCFMKVKVRLEATSCPIGKW